MCAALHRALTEAPQAVASRVDGLRSLVGSLGVEDTTLLDREQKDESVNEPQELVEVVLWGESASLERGAERLVVGMRKKALAEGDEGVLYATSQVFACSCPLFATCVAPSLEWALGNRPIGATESALVPEQP